MDQILEPLEINECRKGGTWHCQQVVLAGPLFWHTAFRPIPLCPYPYLHIPPGKRHCAGRSKHGLSYGLAQIAPESVPPFTTTKTERTGRKNTPGFLIHPLRLPHPAVLPWSDYRPLLPSFQTAFPDGLPAADWEPSAPASSDCRLHRPAP